MNIAAAPLTQNAAELLKPWIAWPNACPIAISGLSMDSRLTASGDLFIATAGIPEERPRYIAEAIAKGAVAVLRTADADTQSVVFVNDAERVIPIVAIPNLAEVAGMIVARYYGNPSAHMTMIGITGTNGKTSCSHFIAQALGQTHKACGIIGTLGFGFPGHLQSGQLTTPGAIELQQQLNCLKQQGAHAIAMEVSSHSLVQHRVSGVAFTIAVFTNLTQDHLDYHGTLENYAAAKRQLFLQPGLRYAVINADDPYGRQWLTEFSTTLTCYAYSLQPKSSESLPGVYAKNIRLDSHGIRADVETPWGEGRLSSALLGRFNLSNLLASLTTLGILGIPLPQALKALSTVTTVPGRMQAFGGGKLPLVVVDYAHTPDALMQALNALRPHCKGKLWCVFGCGGNRDATKRPLMGKAAEKYSDHMVITNDNPRFEDPGRIIGDIVKGLICPWAVDIEPDRAAAIAHVIGCAEAGDVVLVAGKGHESYQHIQDRKLPFNDAEQVKLRLHLKGSSL